MPKCHQVLWGIYEADIASADISQSQQLVPKQAKLINSAAGWKIMHGVKTFLRELSVSAHWQNIIFQKHSCRYNMQHPLHTEKNLECHLLYFVSFTQDIVK